MEDVDVRSILTQLGIDYRDRGSQLVARCPNPAHEDKGPSWSMSTESPYPHHCFGCGFKGNLWTLVKNLGGGKVDVDELRRAFYRIQFFTSDRNPSPSPSQEDETLRRTKITVDGRMVDDPLGVPLARDYCRKRFITREFIRHYSLTYAPNIRVNGTPFVKRVCIPIRETGKTIAIEGRSIDGSKPKLLYPRGSRVNTLFDYDRLDRREGLCLTEGITDLPQLFNIGLRNLSCTFGAHITPRQGRLLGEFPNLTVVPDNDEAGLKFLTWIDEVYPWDFLIAFLPEHRKDAGECTAGEIADALEHSIPSMEYFRRKHGIYYEPEPKVTWWA